MEIDLLVVQIVQDVEENQIRDKTLVISTSDNGPGLSYANHSGHTPFREGKGTSFDGGIRSPLIVSWPGKVEKNSTSYNTLFSIDGMPTIAGLADGELPEKEIDGKDVWCLIIEIGRSSCR